MSKSRLDWKLGATTKKSAAGDFGIEIELEGALAACPQSSKFWCSKEEGSLRQGVEYVLMNPVAAADLPAALKEIGTVLSKSKPKLSIRCSTHIHVNVLQKTNREIYNILAYYYLVEDILVRTQGPLRMGNLFCLRMSDAEVIGSSLAISAKNEHFFKEFNMGNFKYGALNLAAPSKFGSLEFRFLRPIIDMDVLSKWCAIFHMLVNKACHFDVKHTLRDVQEMPPREFLSKVWPKGIVDELLSFGPGYETEELLLQNFEHVAALRDSLKPPKYFKIPQVYLDDDLSESPWRKAQASMDGPAPSPTIQPMWAPTTDDDEFFPDDEHEDDDDDE